MCRLFALHSPKKRDAFYYLVDSECSLLRQSDCRKGQEQGDGWGIAHYLDRSVHLFKSTNPVYKEKKQFKIAASEASSEIIIAHIRRASNPRKLSKNDILTPESTQPFVYKNMVFAHNGTIHFPDTVADSLGPYKRMIQGPNDSEVYFWLVMKNFDGRNMAKALATSANSLWDLWEDCGERKEGAKDPYTGLNCMMSDGKRVYAFCKYDSFAGESLCYETDLKFRMWYATDGSSLVIASERMDESHDWKPIENNVLLTGELRNGRARATETDLTGKMDR